MKKKIIAIIYDFDGTLTPLPMQEYTLFPEIGIDAKMFWEKVRRENKKIQGDEITTYMRLMMDKCMSESYSLTEARYKKLAKQICYFKGVENYFNQINRFVQKESKRKIELRHYIISAGLKEIIDVTSISKHFYNVFASEYMYDDARLPYFPKIIINDTMKTQFLFRINKGKEKLHESINEHTPENKRPIPFEQMIYIGDGLTDVPCMALTKKNGGTSIAVYQTQKHRQKCQKLKDAKRVDFIAHADYRENKALQNYLKIILQEIIANILS